MPRLHEGSQWVELGDVQLEVTKDTVYVNAPYHRITDMGLDKAGLRRLLTMLLEDITE